MRRFWSLALLVAVLSGAAPAQDKEEGLIVHEWGVTTIHQGSDRATVRLPAAELPAFVLKWEDIVKKQIEEWSQSPRLGGKPIVYFYSPRKALVKVRVSVPTGRPHAWWPPASSFGPSADIGTPSVSAIKPENGFLEWTNLVLDPGAQVARPAGGWWATARQTDATPVLRGSDAEHFLFYEALVTYDADLAVEWKEDRVEIRNVSKESIPQIWAVRVRDGKCRSASSKLEKGARAELTLAKGSPTEFKAALIAAGLYEKEADAFLAAWKDEFFATDGVRVLALLPQEAYDRLLPLKIEPAPKEVKRVMVAHIECLDEEREAQIARWIEQLGADDPAERDAATEKLKALRPLADRLMEEALKTEKDGERRERLKKLLGR